MCTEVLSQAIKLSLSIDRLQSGTILVEVYDANELQRDVKVKWSNSDSLNDLIVYLRNHLRLSEHTPAHEVFYVVGLATDEENESDVYFSFMDLCNNLREKYANHCSKCSSTTCTKHERLVEDFNSYILKDFMTGIKFIQVSFACYFPK
jgi:hypothetical protein